MSEPPCSLNLPAPYVYTPELVRLSGARLRLRPDIFSAESVTLEIPAGVSVLAAVRMALRENGYKISLRGARIYFAEDFPVDLLKPLSRPEWNTTLVRKNSLVNLVFPVYGGGSGKNPFGTILSIVVMAAAVMTGTYVAGFFAQGSLLGAAAGALASAAVGIAGSLLINAICPPSQPKLTQSNAKAEDVWSLDGMQNRAAQYEPIPWILGKVRFAPRFAALPYTFLNGNNQIGRYLFAVAGHNQVKDLRIGDTAISSFKDVRYVVWENWTGQALSFFPNAVYQDDLSIKLNSSGQHLRTTTLDTTEIQIEFYLPKGLGRIDREGTLHSHTVGLTAYYRRVGTQKWIPWWAYQEIYGGSVTIPYPNNKPTWKPAKPSGSNHNRPTAETLQQTNSAVYTGEFNIYATADGGVSTTGGVLLLATITWREEWLYQARLPPRPTGWELKSQTATLKSRNNAFSGAINISGGYVYIGAGDYGEPTKYISMATITPQRFGYSKTVPAGQYEVLISCDAGTYDYDPGNQIFNEVYWSALRSVRTGPVIRYNGVPLTVIELEIRASDQLNGHVDEFNAEFTSYAPVWNGAQWITQPSNNPAALGMLLAVSPVVHKDIDDIWSQIDLPAWQAFYNWCQEQGWQYNSVQTSEERAGDVLHNILAAARAAFTFRNASLYSVVWDTPGKPLAYAFGPRNSWGFQANKTFKEEKTHALRVSFLNEERDFQEDERIVYNDGYNAANATNIIEKDYDGVTNPANIYKLARLTLADEVWRPETYTLSTDYAFLVVSKGDRVNVSHYVPMWGIAQARITGVLYADYDYEAMNDAALIALAVQHQEVFAQPGESVSALTTRLEAKSRVELIELLENAGLQDTTQAVGVQIDDYVSMEDGKAYAFNYYPSGSQCIPFSVETEAGTTNMLHFQTPVPSPQAPEFMGLISFGLAERVDHACIVTSIEPGDNFTATIVLQDYSAEEIQKSLTEAIPPWNSDITIPSRWELGKPNPPTVLEINTDEYVLRRADDGSLIPRIQVAFKVSEKQGVVARDVGIQIRRKPQSGDEAEAWREAGMVRADDGYIYAEGVEEKVEYELRLYTISNLGIPSRFSPVYTAYVIGRTTPPPPPINLRLQSSKIMWEMPENYPIDVRGWEIWLGMDAEDPFEWAKKISNPYSPVMEFDLSAWAGWARRVWVRTIDDIGLTSEAVYYSVNLGDVPVKNIVLEIKESERNWPGTVKGGTLYRGGHGLVSLAGRQMWGTTAMWGDVPMWGGNVRQMTYVTFMTIPAKAVGSNLRIVPLLETGAVVSIEWQVAYSRPMWGDSPMWGNVSFMGIEDSGAWQPLPDNLFIDKEFLIGVRVTYGTADPAISPDILWVFDVEDEEARYNGVEVEPAGTRLPIEPRRFRWISGVTFGLSKIAGGADAVRVIRGADTEVIEDGFVVAGPIIYCFDENNNPASGRVDALVQGAKGDLNYG